MPFVLHSQWEKRKFCLPSDDLHLERFPADDNRVSQRTGEREGVRRLLDTQRKKRKENE